MTDKEKIIRCFNDILLNKKSKILNLEYSHHDLVIIIDKIENNEIWFTFNKDGRLVNFY